MAIDSAIPSGRSREVITLHSWARSAIAAAMTTRNGHEPSQPMLGATTARIASGASTNADIALCLRFLQSKRLVR